MGGVAVTDFYKRRRPIDHHDDDDYAPYWRYDKDCGCSLCLAWEDEMYDDLESDWWDAVDYYDDYDWTDDQWSYDRDEY